jgi:hypothetical protein
VFLDFSKCSHSIVSFFWCFKVTRILKLQYRKSAFG